MVNVYDSFLNYKGNIANLCQFECMRKGKEVFLVNTNTNMDVKSKQIQAKMDAYDLKNKLNSFPYRQNDKLEKIDIIKANLIQNFQTNSKHWNIFMPKSLDHIKYLTELFKEKNFLKGRPWGPEMSMVFKDMNSNDTTDTSKLVFTNKVYLYVDLILNTNTKNALKVIGEEKKLTLQVRDKKYFDNLKIDVFICHDSRDKPPFAKNLAKELQKVDLKVWYDDFSLEIGDGLIESIQKALSDSKKCILIISQNFLNNNGWVKKEFTAISTRETKKKEEVILPIWHGVNANEVYEYSPFLADKYAIDSSKMNIKEIANEISNQIKKCEL